MRPDSLKIEIATPAFFSIPLRRVAIETVAETGRTYFILDGKIIAVAKRVRPDSQSNN
jgi:hypothetical protein